MALESSGPSSSEHRAGQGEGYATHDGGDSFFARAIPSLVADEFSTQAQPSSHNHPAIVESIGLDFFSESFSPQSEISGGNPSSQDVGGGQGNALGLGLGDYGFASAGHMGNVYSYSFSGEDIQDPVPSISTLLPQPSAPIFNNTTALQNAAHFGGTHVSTPGFCQSPQMFWPAISLVNRDENTINQLRVTLRDNIGVLLTQLDSWLLSPFSDEPIPYNYPSPISGGASIYGGSVGPFNTDGRLYAPDYKISEVNVIKDAMTISHDISGFLENPRTASFMLWVSNRLWGLRGRLEDIGFARTLLANLGFSHLRILEMTAILFGRADWVLQDLWTCAADCVEHMDASHYGAAAAAQTASTAAYELISIRPHLSAFYEALYLRYSSLLRANPDDSATRIALLSNSLFQFGGAMESAPSGECLREMLRAIVAHCRDVTDTYAVEVALETISRTTVDMLPDPSLAALYCEIADLLDNLQDQVSPHRLELSRRMHPVTQRAINVLQFFMSSRPSRLQLAFLLGLEAFAKEHHREGSYTAAISIFHAIMPLVRLEEENEVKSLVKLAMTRVQISAHPLHWKNALTTFKRLLSWLPYMRLHLDPTSVICSCLRVFDHFCRHSMTSGSISLVQELLRMFGPQPSSSYQLAVILQLLELALGGVTAQRCLGAFEDSLKTSKLALAIVEGFQDGIITDSEYRYIYVRILACHARCLLDCDAEDTIIFLKKAIPLCDTRDPWFPQAYAKLFGQFALLQVDIDQILPIDEGYVPPNEVSSWFTSGIGNRERSWLLLLKALSLMGVAVKSALKFAREALAVLSNDSTSEDRPQKLNHRLLTLVHKYILLVLLDRLEEAVAIAEDIIGLYQAALDTDPHWARLPLLLMLEAIILLFLNIGDMSLPKTLKGDKKTLYRGLISFDDLADLLRSLPRYFRLMGPESEDEADNSPESCS